MHKIIKLSSLVLIGIFLFSACSKRRIVIPAPMVKKSQVNTWGEKTNLKEDIDTSDLEQENTVNTISNAAIREDVPSKMERVRFPAGEYNALAKMGNGTVKGSIYLKNPYNKRVLGANTRLYLNPITSYAKQWFHESYLGGHKMEKADNRLFNYLRFTSSNSQGKFAFYGVPNGKYYLIGTVKCAAQCGYSTPKNIRIATEVTIRENELIQRDLSRLID